MRLRKYSSGFTLIELLITITVIAVLAGIVTFAATTLQKNTRDTARDAKVQILANALEKYYRDNGEYPSVAAMTSSNIDALKKKLKIPDTDTFKLPGATAANSVAVSGASPSTLVYSANTTDSTKNAQCQTAPDGYCDGYTLAYVKESTGQSATVQSLHATFTAVKDSSTCDEGDTQNGTTCTHSYPATQQAGTYSCPGGMTLSGTTCTSTYSASYSSGGSYYYCNGSNDRLSGRMCFFTNSYMASRNGSWQCSRGTLKGYGCVETLYTSATEHKTPKYKEVCTTNKKGKKTCTQEISGYTYSYTCPSGWSQSGSSCSIESGVGSAEYVYGPYYCQGTDTLSGTTCTGTVGYAASEGYYSGYYYCSGSDSLSGSNCTKTQAATQSPTYYTCPNGGTPTGSTCSYTYELQG